MPQSVCCLCADKINDFFEYREMCTATNIQTRCLLGLPELATAGAGGRKRKKVKMVITDYLNETKIRIFI